MLYRSIQMITMIALALYPIAIYFGLTYWGLNYLLPLLLMLFCLRFLLTTGKLQQLVWLSKLIAFSGLMLVLASWLLKQQQWLLFYPVVINAIMLMVFAFSLTQPQSIIERFARLLTPDLPTDAIVYTRRVTQLWCLFFLINGAIALITCLIDNQSIWALYNGVISYILIAILMGCEWIIRTRKIRSR